MPRKKKVPPPLPGKVPKSGVDVVRKEGKKKKKRELSAEIKEARYEALFNGMIIYMQHPALDVIDVWRKYRTRDDDNAPMIREVIGQADFRNQAAKRKWKERREDHWLAIEKRVMAEAQTQAVEKELAEVSILEAVGEVVLGHVTGVTSDTGEVIVHQARAKSLEGVVKVFIDLDKHKSAKRQRVMAALASAVSHEEAGGSDALNGGLVEPEIEDNMSDDEIALFAEELAMRRAGLIEEKNNDDRDDSGSDGDEEGDPAEADDGGAGEGSAEGES